MSIGKMCSRMVDTAEQHESAHAAASRMNARNVGCLVVVNLRNEPVGLITDRDLVLNVMAQSKDPFQTRLEDIMTYQPSTIGEEAEVEEALALMRSGPHRRLPVVDEQGKLIGLVTLDDILELIADEFSQVRRLLENESPSLMARTVLS